MTQVCDGVNKGFDAPNCQDKISDIFWVLVLIFILINLLFRLALARILYYYYKAKHHEQHGPVYTELSG